MSLNTFTWTQSSAYECGAKTISACPNCGGKIRGGVTSSIAALCVSDLARRLPSIAPIAAARILGPQLRLKLWKSSRCLTMSRTKLIERGSSARLRLPCPRTRRPMRQRSRLRSCFPRPGKQLFRLRKTCLLTCLPNQLRERFGLSSPRLRLYASACDALAPRTAAVRGASFLQHVQ